MATPIASAAGNLGGAASFTHNGFTYSVHALTDVMRASLSRWAKKYALDELRKLRDLFPPKDYDLQVSALIREFTAGRYEFGEEAYASIINTPSGYLTFLATILQRDDLIDEQLKELDRDKGDEIIKLWFSVEGIDPDKAREPSAPRGEDSPNR